MRTRICAAALGLGILAQLAGAGIVEEGLSIHYRADNVDGSGPGHAGTTLLSNLANPGTHDGTIVNGSGVTQNAGQAATPFAYGVVLDDTLQTHIQANTYQIAGGVNKATSATWEFWLRADSGVTSNRGALYGEFPAGTVNETRHYLRLQGIGTTTRNVGYDEWPPSGGSASSDSPLFDTGTFAQIVVTKNGNTLTFYKDGAQVGGTKTSSETFTGGSIVQTLFGKRTSQNESFDGQFCIIRVYETVLSSTEVLQNYNAEPLSFASSGIVWANPGVSNVTSIAAWAYATVSNDLTEAVLVWDTTDHDVLSTNDWPNRVALGPWNDGDVVTGEMTNLLEKTDYFWRFYGYNATTNGWLGSRFFTTLDVTPPELVPPFSPVAGAMDVDAGSSLTLVATFNEAVEKGASGNIVITNLTDGVATTIPIGDGQVNVTGTTLSITANLLRGKDYAVLIDAGAIQDSSANPFAGISDPDVWRFTTVTLDSFLRIHYRADNVDGSGPGHAGTTLLSNLANPGTHDGTIVKGSGVTQNDGQAATPFAYGVVLDDTLQTHIQANTYQIAGGVNKATSATWEFWLRADSGVTSNRGVLYGEFPAGTVNETRHYLLLQGIGTTTRNVLYDEWPPSGGSASSDSPLFDTGTFAQIVVTKNGNTLTFYKDGAQVGGTKTSSETFTGGSIVQTLFGKRTSHNESFDGQFCIIRVYETVLSSAEVLQNYNAEPLATLPPRGTAISIR